MPTTVTSSIGTTGRDYSTLQAWEDACPANLVTSDQIWRGEAYNDSSFTASTTVSGVTCDSTRYIELTAAAGQSFVDNGSIQTTALRANASNGAILAGSFGYGSALDSNGVSYFRLSRLQVKNTASNGESSFTAGANGLAERCIFEGSGFHGFKPAGEFRNCLVVALSTNATHKIARAVATFTARSCTFVSLGTTFTSWWAAQYNTATLINCGVFGATDIGATNGTQNKTNCYSDGTSNTSGWTIVAFDTTTGSGFENITSGTHDFRIKSTSALKDAGSTDATSGADIAGTSRPSGSAYDVGCWEFVSASAASAAFQRAFPRSILNF